MKIRISKSNLILSCIIIFLIIFSILYILLKTPIDTNSSSLKTPTDINNGSLAKVENSNNFAKCLTDKGVKLYGAYWCGHCNTQKQMFGKDNEYLDYIECSTPDNKQTEACQNAGIMAYPTWEFADGNRIEGGLTFEEISKYSGCALK